MEKNDYGLKKITSLCAYVQDVQTLEYLEEPVIVENIIINKDILEACGFKYDDAKYVAKLQNERESCVITADILPGNHIYTIYASLEYGNIRLEKQIVVLSELQDWVRQITGFELDINESKLVAACK